MRGAHLFRVVRDADFEIRELEASDLISTIEETLRLRRFGDPVLLEVQPSMPEAVRNILMESLKLDEEDVFQIDGMLGMEALWELSAIDKPALRFPALIPHLPEALNGSKSIFEAVRQKDVLLHHPYDSFRAVEEFVASAAKDPAVLGIKQTLYRVGKESPIVESLRRRPSKGSRSRRWSS